MTEWKPIATAPKMPMTGTRGPIIVGSDGSMIGKTFWVHDHPRGSNVWLLIGEGGGLFEWSPKTWVSDPSM